MTAFHIDPRALMQAIEDTRSCHNALVADRDDLESFLRNLHAEWYGSAADRWKDRQNQWNTACDEVNGILRDLIIALEKAYGNYTGVSFALEQMWSS